VHSLQKIYLCPLAPSLDNPMTSNDVYLTRSSGGFLPF